ncbi:MAG: NAD(+) synthase [Gemmataceae bacterium]
MPHYGFVRVAAATPALALADPATNAKRTLDLIRQATKQRVAIVVFPEMGLTGYTCHDLFHQPTLLRAAATALEDLVSQAELFFDGLAVVGLPLVVDHQVFNCAAVFAGGRVLGIVPKSYLPNYKEYYDGRYFSPAVQANSDVVVLPSGAETAFGTDLLFDAEGIEGLTVGVEICEDLWSPIPPSSHQALAGATVLLNLSASNELIGKVNYRRQLIEQQSARCMAAYVYAGAGPGESTQDLVFGGHCLIAENGSLIAQSQRFDREPHLLVAAIDLDHLRGDRLRTTSFAATGPFPTGGPFRRIGFELEIAEPKDLLRVIDAHPFVPADNSELRARCEEIFAIQTAGLARRLSQIGKPSVSIGVSGGLDSTLALLVACKTFDLLGETRSKIRGFSLPGFGTTPRTRANAQALMKHLGIGSAEIDIRELCLAEWKALGHSPFGIDLNGSDVDALTSKLGALPPDNRSDLVFENVQARMRTSLLMNSGFVIGTGDLSELALGWCTYNADHMNMYAVNVSVPKTLVKFLVGWAAEQEFKEPARSTLKDIVATVISPELLPTSPQGTAQSTEATIGPYELHDFFLYHFLRYGVPPAKILFLARHAKFDREYSTDEIKKWLILFLKRFFANQFKRSCLPDGPKVGSVSLSPRGDWRMPSDANVAAWLAELE